ncbi:hypothetical protein ACHAXS_011774 [Conticribra weissflogii]
MLMHLYLILSSATHRSPQTNYWEYRFHCVLFYSFSVFDDLQPLVSQTQFESAMKDCRSEDENILRPSRGMDKLLDRSCRDNI